MILRDRVCEFTAGYFAVEVNEVSETTNFSSDLDAMWLEHVYYLMQIEDQFGVDIKEADILGLTTVGEVIQYIEKQLRPN